MVTGSESGVMALAITPPGVFGDLLARLQTERRDLGSARSAQPVTISRFCRRHISKQKKEADKENPYRFFFNAIYFC